MGSDRPRTALSRRFVVESRAGQGAFGEVHRGRDRQTGEPVAIKRLRQGLTEGDAAARFEREARLLSRIASPHVVGYVAHGVDPDGSAWLALEWLDGSDLGTWQREQPLSMRGAVDVARQAALGLAALHDQGIVHRDVKPSNFFLVPDGQAGFRVKLIDLGVARAPADLLMTSAGLRIGTPAYMSPEQAAGDARVGPASDVFSLGIVLYELLTGRRPYSGRDAVALLAKIVLEEPPRARDAMPDLPPELDQAVAHAMGKRVAERPESARAFAEQLAALDVPELPTKPSADEVPTAAVRASDRPEPVERRVVTTLFLAFAPGTEAETAARVEAMATEHGASTHPLLGRRLVAVFGGRRSSGDEALRAARAALAITAAFPSVRVALATGRALSGRMGTTGQLIDRGARALEQATSAVRIDELTSRLVAHHFVVEHERGAHLLREERPVATASVPRLLGREVPFVGRERELERLEDLVRDSQEQGEVRAAVVVGALGVGKSRLRHELLAALQDADPAPRTALARGDPMLEEVPLGMLAAALRDLAGIDRADPHEAQRRRVVEWAQELELSSPPALLEELLRVAHEDDPDLRAARADPGVLAARLREAAAELLSRLADGAGVVLVLEDLQWADGSTMELLGWVLDALVDRPLCVIAFGRPETRERWGTPWSAVSPDVVELEGLSSRAAERLVRALVPDADRELVRSVVGRAGGNPLFLEELVRATLQGELELPLAIQAAFQVRLDALPGPAKQVALAASVFGRALWQQALEQMVPRHNVAVAVDVLERWEVLAERPRSRFAGTRELVFRHALLRDVAYAMLPDESCSAHHSAAADWLDAQGERDAAVLAHHREHAGQHARAAELYAAAAAEALRENASDIAVRHAEHGLRLAPSEPVQARLCAIAARACHVLGRYDEGLAHADNGLEVADEPWRVLQIAATRTLTLRRRGRMDESWRSAQAALDRTRDAPNDPELSRWRAEVRTELAWTAYNAGDPERAERLAREVLEEIDVEAPELTALVLSAQHALGRSLHGLGRLEEALEAHRAVVDRATMHGHRWRGEGARHGLGQLLLAVGRIDEALQELERAREAAAEIGLPSTSGWATHFRSLAHLRRRELEAAARDATSAAMRGRELGQAALEAAGEAVEAVAALERGHLAEARQHVESVEGLAHAPAPWRLLAAAVRACVALADGVPADARRMAEQVADALEAGVAVHEGHDLAAALAARVLEAVGDAERAVTLRGDVDPLGLTPP